jgi:hypothetical protein
MKTLAIKPDQFLTDAKGNRTGVILDLQTYQHLRDAEEELADIQAYDSSAIRVHSQVAAGDYLTLSEYKTGRRRKAK